VGVPAAGRSGPRFPAWCAREQDQLVFARRAPYSQGLGMVMVAPKIGSAPALIRLRIEADLRRSTVGGPWPDPVAAFLHCMRPGGVRRGAIASDEADGWESCIRCLFPAVLRAAAAPSLARLPTGPFDHQGCGSCPRSCWPPCQAEPLAATYGTSSVVKAEVLLQRVALGRPLWFIEGPPPPPSSTILSHARA